MAPSSADHHSAHPERNHHGVYQPGRRVNLEVDLLARYLERLLLGDKAAEPTAVALPKAFWPPTATSNPD
jgi:hypothetical protein